MLAQVVVMKRFLNVVILQIIQLMESRKATSMMSCRGKAAGQRSVPGDVWMHGQRVTGEYPVTILVYRARAV